MIDKTISLDIINAYRNGLVPAKGIEYVVVGLEKETKEIQNQLEYIKQNRSNFKFINGGYGSGKTFLCSLIREHALKDNFLVSALTISQEAPLHKFEIFYNKIMQGIRTKQKQSSPAFGDIIELWLFELEEKLSDLHKLDPSIDSERKKLFDFMGKEIENELKTLSSFESSFANGFRSYYLAKQSGDSALAQSALGWLKGETNIPTSIKKKIQVKKNVDVHTSINFLKAFLHIIGRIGYSGLVILVDELETIQRLPTQAQRNAAYQNLRRILDMIGENELQRCYFLFTGTESLFEDEYKGIPSYEALNGRIKYFEDSGQFKTLKQPVIKLEGFNTNKLIEVAKKLNEIHSIAYGWDTNKKFPEEFVKSFAKYAASGFGGEIKKVPRGFLKEHVHLLDLGVDNPDFDPYENYLKDKETFSRIKKTEEIQSHIISL